MFRRDSLATRIISAVLAVGMVWSMSPASVLAENAVAQNAAAAQQPAAAAQDAQPAAEAAKKTPATIHFDANGGSGSLADAAIEDSSSFELKLPASKMARDGYVFAGWSTTPDGKDAEDGSGKVVMPAVFVPDAADISAWKFSWDANGDGKADPQTETSDLSSCVKDGTLTLYAQWTRMTTTVHFDANGASSGTMADETFAWDTATALAANAYVREGYRFSGWSTTADGRTVQDDPATAADETFLATSVADGAQMLRDVASYDSDGDGKSETYDLSYAVKGPEAAGTIVLYAQWEKLPDETPAAADESPSGNAQDSSQEAASAADEKSADGNAAAEGGDRTEEKDSDETFEAEGTASEATNEIAAEEEPAESGLAAESDADHLKNAAPAAASSDNALADVRDADNGGADDLELKIEDTSALVSAAQSFMSLFAAPAETSDAAPADNPSQDGASIKELSVKWLTAGTASPDDSETTVFRPSDNGTQIAKGQIYLSLDGTKNYEAGAVRLVIPGHIFTGRDGNRKGNLVLPVAENPSTKTEFNWSYDAGNDVYTLTSTRPISGRSEITFQFGIENLTPSDLVDGQASSEFLAKAYVTNSKGNLLTKTSNSIKAAFDTSETLKSATMSPNGQIPWETKVPASEIPEDKRIEGVDSYLVVTYYTYAYHEGNTAYTLGWSTQNADFGAYDQNGNKVADGTVISGGSGTDMDNGWSGNGNTGYRFVKVAYPFSAFAVDTDYTLNAKTIWTLTETDDQLKTPQTQSAETSVKFAWHNPVPVPPGGHYAHMNWGDDNDDAFTIHWSVNGYQYDYANRDFHKADLTEGYYGIYRTALNDLAEGSDATVRYQKYLRGFMLPDEHNQGSSDYTKLTEFTSPVHMVLEDGDYSFAQNAASPAYQRLTAGVDYDITSLLVCKPTSVYKATEVDASDLQSKDFLYETGSGEPYYYAPGSQVQGGTYGVAYERTTDIDYYPASVVEAEVDGSWQAVSTIDWKTADSDKVAVELPTGTQRWRVTVASDSIGAEGQQCAGVATQFVCPTVVLHPTDTVKQMAGSAITDMTTPECLLQSTDSFNAYQQTGTVSFSYSSKGTDHLFGYNSNVMAVPSASASASAWDESKTKVTLTFTGTVQEESSVLDRTTWEEAISQGKIASETSGTWYDLLPQGAVADLSTIQLRDGDSTQDAYTIDNYKGSGRQLLVVKAHLVPQAQYKDRDGVKYVEDAPSISFKASYSMSSYLDYGGQNLHNVVVFESGNDQLGNVEHYIGQPDDPAQAASGDATVTQDITEQEKEILRDLDPASDKPVFAYAAASASIGAYTYTNASFDKQVDANGEQDYGHGISTEDGEKDVYLGGVYSYKLSLASGKGSHQGLVMYDRLEDPRSGTIPDGTASWKGTLVSVDVSRLEALGADPVIYYSTASNLELASMDDGAEEGTAAADADLSDTERWSTTAPADLSQVTAIAIDCSKRADGSDFVLQAGQMLSAVVSMRAPSDESMLGLRAYNDAYFLSSTSNAGAVDDAVMTHRGHTELVLKPYKLHITSTWNDENDRDGLRPKGQVVLHLFANGSPAMASDGKDIEVTVDPAALSDGYVCSQDLDKTFDSLPVADAAGNAIHYTASLTNEDGSAIAGYTQSVSFKKDEDGTQVLALTQTHEPAKTSVSGHKTWAGDSEDIRPATVSINLLADGKTEQTKQIMEAASGEWTYSFGNLNKYENHGEEIAYTVSESGAEDYALAVTKTASGYDLANTYHPYGNLTISKTVKNGTDKTEGQKFAFHISLTKADGSDYTDSITAKMSDGTAVTLYNGGTIELAAGESCTLQELPKGTSWKVSEDAAPGYVADAAEKSGTIKPNAENAAAFTNDYKTSADVTLQATKTLSGRDIQYGQFTFELRDQDGALVRSAANDEKGNVAFGAIHYANADTGKTFTYTITEKDAARPGYTYDPTAFKAEVTPTDKGDGTMDVSVAYYKIEADGTKTHVDTSTPSFGNVYKATGSVTLTAYKQLKGRDLKDKEFTFDLHDGKTGQVIATAQNDASGKIDFTPDAVAAYIEDHAIQGMQDLSYNETDRNETYAYYVTEEKGADDTVNYSSEVFAWTVTVQDDGDGHMSEATTNVDASRLLQDCTVCHGTGKIYAGDGTESICSVCNGSGKDVNAVNPDWTATATAALPSFTNTLKDGSLSIEKKAENAPDGDQTPFTFDVDVKDADGRPLDSGDVSYTVEDVDSSATAASSAQNGNEEKSQSGNPVAGALQSLASLLQPTQAYAEDTDAAGKTYTITYKAVGGTFKDGSTENKVTYRKDAATTTKYSHTPNVDDSGYAAETYPSMPGRNDVVTIPGAKHLTIDVWYSVAGSADDRNLYDWLAIYPAGIVPSDSNSAQATISGGRLGSGQVGDRLPAHSKDDAEHKQYIVDGDTAQFYFYGDMGGAYGYYAVITDAGTSIDKGAYEEPGDSAQLFYGWFKDEACTEKVDDPEALGEDTTVYGKADVCEGTWGTCPWKITKDGTLFIGSGIGADTTADVSWHTWEANVPWSKYAESIKAVKADGVVILPADSHMLFDSCRNATAIDLSGFDTSSVTDMQGMFYGCSSLASLDLSGFDTANVTNMASMFSGCSSLRSLDLRSFDTSKVSSMAHMFEDCTSMRAVNVGSFDTSNVTTLNGMFASCYSLISLDLSSFWTGNVQDYEYMFDSCISLASLDIYRFDTSNFKDYNCWARYFFMNTGNLKRLTLSKSASNIFYYAYMPYAPDDDGVHDGKWMREDAYDIKMTPDELRNYYHDAKAPSAPCTWIWSTKESAVVTFDGNGGDGSMASYRINSDLITLPDCGFYRDNYAFTGWSTQKDGTGDLYQPGDIFDTGNKNTTLYAQWKKSGNKAQVTNGHFTVTIKAGQRVTIKGLPGGATYTVHEHSRAGWVLKSSEDSTGTIPALGTASSQFTNAYNPKATSVSLTATKTLDGKTPKDGAYQFWLVQVTPDAPMPEGSDWVSAADFAKLVNNKGSLVDFGSIIYTKPGIYLYGMGENQGNDGSTIYDSHQVDVKVVVSDPTGTGALQAKVTYSSDNTFKNRTATGGLTVAKKVSGTEDTSKSFSFVVSLSDAKHQPVTGKFGNVYVLNGKGNFTLTAGAEIALSDLPLGTQYRVEEVDLPDGYTSASENASGTIASNDDWPTATFTNTYSADPTSVYLTASKSLNGRALKDKEFSFELKNKDGEVLQTAKNDGSGSVSFEPISLNGPTGYWYVDDYYGYKEWIPGTESYFIDEVKPSDSASDIQYSDEVYEYEVTVTDNGAGQLESSVQIWSVDPSTHDRKSQVDAASFTNSVKTGSVSLTKKVEETADGEKTFDFQTKLTDSAGAPLDGSYSWTSSRTDKDGNPLTGSVKNGDTLQLAKDETVTISGLPAGSKYEFAEEGSAGYTQTGSENLDGIIKADDTIAATAVNTYAASGTAQVKAKKVVLRSGQETAPDNGAFTFTLAGKSDSGKDNSSTSFDTPVSTATNDGEGNITFRKLVYTADDSGKDFIYQIQEVDDGKRGYDYDSHKYLAKVTPTDKGDGTMECKVQYSTDGGTTWTDEVPVFRNDTVTRMPVAGADGFAGLIAAGGAILVLSALAWLRRKRHML